MAVAPFARADNTTFHGTASGSVATTDNETGAATGSPGRRASILTDIRPGALLTYNSRRHIHEVNAEVDFIHNLRGERPSVTWRAGWKAFLLLGPRSDATITANASMGQLYALAASSSPLETPTSVLPLGRIDTSQVDAAEHASWQATKGSRIWQRVFTRYTTTDDNTPGIDVHTKSFDVGFGIGFDRRLRSHNFAFEVGGSYVHLKKLDPNFRQMGSRIDNQLNPRGVFVWQYDIDKRWSSNLDVGVVYVNPIDELFGRDLRDPYNPDEERRSAPFPIFGGVLAYTDVWGRAMLNARRAMTPNLFIAQNTISDSARLTFAMPLKFLDKDSSRRRPKVVGVGTVGFDRSQLLDPVTNDLRGEFKVARLDLAVGWSPRPGQTFGIRYELAYQSGDQIGEMIVPSFFRNTFYFTFALRYPEDIQVRVPRRHHQSLRADRTDLAPIGAEPVVIDPAELLEPE